MRWKYSRSKHVRALLAFAVLAALARPALAAGDPSATRACDRWGAEYFPNVPLVTHEGATVRFFDDVIRDKVVIIDFIYTSCPDACPLETAKLAEVQDLLGARVGRDVFLYSISIDPEHDTPAVLREYAERFQAGPGWLFLTGAKADVRLLREKLGMIRSGEERLQDHALSLLIGNQATGQWIRCSPMENPYFLAEQVGGWLHNGKVAPARERDYADAPALRSVSRGENLFRTRCSVCHGIGAEDGLVRQGPDLLGVGERREPAWLARWIAEPDAMLAEKDPLASELFAAARGIAMPNLRLDAREVEAVLEYVRDESARVREERARRPPARGADAADAGVLAAGDADVSPCCRKRDVLVLGADEALAAVAPGVAAPLARDASPDERDAAPRPARTPLAPPFGAHTSRALALGLAATLALLGLALGRESVARRR